MNIYPLIAARENARRNLPQPARVLYCDRAGEPHDVAVATSDRKGGCLVIDLVSGDVDEME